jgi:hypothetical protein
MSRAFSCRRYPSGSRRKRLRWVRHRRRASNSRRSRPLGAVRPGQVLGRERAPLPGRHRRQQPSRPAAPATASPTCARSPCARGSADCRTIAPKRCSSAAGLRGRRRRTAPTSSSD